MTDKTFAAFLDAQSKKPQTTENTAVFMKILMQGYTEGLGLLGIYITKSSGDLLLFEGSPDSKMLTFVTNKDYFYRIKRNAAPDGKKLLNCRFFSCREIINDVLEDDNIAGLSFNGYEKNNITLEKEYFQEWFRKYSIEKLEANIS